MGAELTGAYSAFALTAALIGRMRGEGGREIRVPLSDVGAATMANLGFAAETLMTGAPRPRMGNDLYGAFGRDFVTRDGQRLYVTNQRADSVSVIDAETLAPLRTIDGFAYPEGIAAHGDQIHVVNWMDDKLVVLDGASGQTLATVPTGSNSRGFGRFIGQAPD